MPITLNGTLGIDAPLGTSSVPSYGNTTNTNTGLYFPSSTTLGLSTNGTAALTIDASQNVGIGTTSPNTKFVVSNAGAAGLEIAPTGFSSAPSIVSYNRSGAAYTQLTLDGSVNVFAISGTERMRLDSSGNLGIGLSNPARRLHVYVNNAQQDAMVQVEQAGAGSPVLGFLKTGVYAWTTGLYTTDNSYRIAASGADLNTNPRLVIDTSGNVGIGTSSPGYRLEVKGASGAQGYLSIHDGTGDTTVSGNNAASLLFQARDTSIRTIAEIDAVNTTTNGTGGAMVFQTRISDTLAERMRIDSSGNLLLGGTANPATPRLMVIGSSTACSAVFAYSSTGEAVQIYNTGNQNYTAMRFLNNNFAAAVGSITCSTSATAYNTSSDYRLKENVQPMTTGLAKISALNPVTYDWISDKSAGEGFIAHELAEHIPLAVTGEKDAVDDEGNIKPQGVDYSKIVVHLVAAIQELKAELDALKGTK